jgi:hypothetical protein
MRIKRYDWTFRPARDCPKDLKLRRANVSGVKPNIVPLCGLIVRLKVIDYRGRTDAAETRLAVRPRADVFSTTPVKHREQPVLARARQHPLTPNKEPWLRATFDLGVNVSECAPRNLKPAQAANSILCPYVPSGRSREGLVHGGYAVDRIPDPGGPFHNFWYVSNTRLSVQRMALYNPYVHPDGWLLPGIKLGWYAHNQGQGDVIGFWSALRAHEGWGFGALPMTGHTGAIAAMIKGGTDPRRKIEPVFARNRTRLTNTVDRRLSKLEDDLDQASDDPLPTLWRGPLQFYDPPFTRWATATITVP